MAETNLGTTTLTSPTDGQTITVSKTSPLYKKYTGLGWAPTTPATPTTPPPTTGGGEDEFNLENLTEGLVSPMDLPDVRQSSRFEVAKGMLEEQAAATFDPQILRQKGTGRSQVSSAQGITGQRLGQNLSSAELSYIQNVQGQVDSQIKELEQKKAAFISEGLFDLAESLSQQQIDLMNAKNNLILQKANLGLNIRQQKQSESQFEINKDININSLLRDVPSGEVVNIGGIEYQGLNQEEIEPFFKGADITRLMLETPAGKTRELTDPNTGETYTITGLAQEDPDIKSVSSYDDQGNLTITRYDMATGELLGQTRVSGVGKSKTGPSMVSVQYPRQSQDVVYNAEGQQVGYAIYNPITGTTKYTNTNNQPMEFPEGGTVGKPTTSTDDDPFSGFQAWLEGDE